MKTKSYFPITYNTIQDSKNNKFLLNEFNYININNMAYNQSDLNINNLLKENKNKDISYNLCNNKTNYNNKLLYNENYINLHKDIDYIKEKISNLENNLRKFLYLYV